MLEIIILLGLCASGILCLYYGADKLVEAASKAGAHLGMSPILIGLTVIAIGTSLPEIFVSLFSAAKGETGLAVGNIVGSNIFNLGAILGITALIAPIRVEKNLVSQEIPILLAITTLISIPLLLNLPLGTPIGILILGAMGVFLVLLRAKSKEIPEIIPEPDKTPINLAVEGTWILAGATLLYLGSEGLVLGSVGLANLLGVEPTIIGLTVLAAGTGSPEIFACIACALKKQPDMALGNIVGSNLFNIFLGLGLTTTFFTIPGGTLSTIDTLTMLALTALLLPFALSQLKIERWEGALLVASYATYLALRWPA